MRRSGAGFVLRRAGAQRVVLGAAFVTILLATTVLALTSMYVGSVTEDRAGPRVRQRRVRVVRPPGRRGRIVAVVGRSGSGKTTLLNCIGGLDRPDEGSVQIDGAEVTGMGEDGLLRLRRETVGFVFQSFGLIPILSARENVGIPLRLLSVDSAEREHRVGTLLGMVGLAEHAEQRPYELSGGQQQRVAVARALASRPSLLLADEPTGQLDSATGRSVMQLVRAVVRSQDLTALVATHDPALIDLADEVYELHDGTLTRAATAPPAA